MEFWNWIFGNLRIWDFGGIEDWNFQEFRVGFFGGNLGKLGLEFLGIWDFGGWKFWDFGEFEIGFFGNLGLGFPGISAPNPIFPPQALPDSQLRFSAAIGASGGGSSPWNSGAFPAWLPRKSWPGDERKTWENIRKNIRNFKGKFGILAGFYRDFFLIAILSGFF